jgi:hypothetical protein
MSHHIEGLKTKLIHKGAIVTCNNMQHRQVSGKSSFFWCTTICVGHRYLYVAAENAKLWEMAFDNSLAHMNVINNIKLYFFKNGSFHCFILQMILVWYS